MEERKGAYGELGTDKIINILCWEGLKVLVGGAHYVS